MSHILFVTPYYPPEVGAAQARISETAARLVQRGHEVTVLTTLPNYPLGVVPPEYQHGERREETHAGVRIVRVWSYVSPNKGFLRRIVSQLSFGCLAPLLGGRAVGRPDVIIVESPPLFDAIAGLVLSWWKGCPYIFTVADVWPASAVQLGVLRNRALIWLAERLEWLAYRRAGAVWAVTAGIQSLLMERGVPPERVFLLPNGVDTSRFRPLPQRQARAELCWDDSFTLLYAGTIGLAHGLGTLLDAAELLREERDIRFLLVGEGAAKAALVADAARRGLENVTFLDARPHALMPLMLAGADACLASLRKVPLFEGALPSKMYEAMACARPLVLAVDGEARALIEEEAGAAIYAEPENPAALAQAILTLRDQPALAAALGHRGRVFVQRHFDRDQLVGMLAERIAALIGAQQTAADPTRRPVPITTTEREGA